MPTASSVSRRLKGNVDAPTQPKVLSTTSVPQPNVQVPEYENVDQFDFNRNYEDTLDKLQRQKADFEQQYDLGNQRTREAYERRLREIQKNQKQAIGQSRDRLANQGILRSGMAVEQAGNIGEEFQGELDTQQRQLATTLEDRESQYAQAQRQIQEQIGRAQEYYTRQQQQLEQQRARQAAEAEAARRAAEEAQRVAQERNTSRLVKDNLGKYFVVNSLDQTRQRVDPNSVNAAQEQFGGPIASLDEAQQFFGGDYASRARALARRLGGNLNDQASLDVRLGFRETGKWGQ